MLYNFALQPSFSPLYKLKMMRRSLPPAFSVPCQFPERSCARAPVPNIVASATMHNISFFIEFTFCDGVPSSFLRSLAT